MYINKIAAFLICFLSILKTIEAQTSIKEGELKIGDVMPDIPFGNVMNYHGEVSNNIDGKTRFSDFRGKLIILDYWDYHCSGCIENFPRISKLQDLFKDKVQFILVNNRDSKKTIVETMTKGRKKRLEDILPQNIPGIFNSSELNKFFPPRGYTGYHVWIDGEGIVRLWGDGRINTYKEKIEDLLAGKQIGFIPDAKNRDEIRTKPFYAMYDRATSPILQYNSTITLFTPELGNYSSGSRVYNKFDSANHTVRNSILNATIHELLYMASREQLNMENVVEWSGQGYNRFVLCVSDTGRYINDRSFYKATDAIIEKSFQNRICYEQITHWSMSDSLRDRYMFEDVSRYIKNLYNAEAKVEVKKMPCYVIVRSSEKDKLKTKTEDKNSSRIVNTTIDGKEMKGYTNYALTKAFQGFLQNEPDFLKGNDIIIDETRYSNNVDIFFPKKNGKLE